jgi:hypothetical protein
MNEPALVVTRAYDLNLWLFERATHLPRSYRVILGDRLMQSGLDLLLLLVRAAYLPAHSPRKGELLDRAGLETNTLRYLLRMTKDLHQLSVDSYSYASERIEEIGRMTGGWRKSLR